VASWVWGFGGWWWGVTSPEAWPEGSLVGTAHCGAPKTIVYFGLVLIGLGPKVADPEHLQRLELER
jgi:hypothetical protein